jgi:hypothetical protein
MATIVLNLDTSDPHARRRLEVLYFTMFNLRRALQRDAQRLCREYWARKAERDVLGWRSVAEDLGLNRRGFEALARGHATASRWAMDHVSAALVNHMSNAVFEDVAHATPPTSGRPSASTAPWRATSTPTATRASADTPRSARWPRCQLALRCCASQG